MPQQTIGSDDNLNYLLKNNNGEYFKGGANQEDLRVFRNR
jgi:hypothetical protein